MKSIVAPLCTALAVLAGPATAQDTPVPRATNEPVTLTAPETNAARAQHSPEIEVAFWDSIKDSDDPTLYLAYLEQFPDGAFRVIARNRLDDLWDRAIRAFALLEDLGVSLDDPVPGAVAPVPTPAPPVVTQPAPTPAPPVVVAPAPTPAPVIVQPASPPNQGAPSWKVVRNAQNQLSKHGCYTGVVDGVWGDRSRAAMRKFNRRAGTSFKVRQPTSAAVSYMRNLTKSGIRICY